MPTYLLKVGRIYQPATKRTTDLMKKIIIIWLILLLGTSVFAAKYQCTKVDKQGRNVVYLDNTPSGKECYPYKSAIVKYGSGECTVDFIVKNNKASYQRVSTPKGMNYLWWDCQKFLEDTYPKSHPNIKILY